MEDNININDTVTVILTDYGQQVLADYKAHLENQLMKDNLILKVGLESMYSCDKNGKYTTELWQLMFIFGQDMQSAQMFNHNKIYTK